MPNHSNSKLPRMKGAVNAKNIQGIYEQNNYTNKYLQTFGEFLITRPIPETPSTYTSSLNPLFKSDKISTKFHKKSPNQTFRPIRKMDSQNWIIFFYPNIQARIK